MNCTFGRYMRKRRQCRWGQAGYTILFDPRHIPHFFTPAFCYQDDGLSERVVGIP
jgi:hypothetical protein